MTEKEEGYKLALEKSRIYLDNPQGLVNQDVAQANDKILIRQNNVIIIMLSQIYVRLKNLEEKVGQPSASTSTLETDIEELTKTLANTQIDKGKNRVVEPVVKMFALTNTEHKLEVKPPSND